LVKPKDDPAYLQVLPPAGPVHLPEQHSPALVHALPLGNSRQPGAFESSS